MLRAALRLAALCVLLGALGWGWELLARQAPSSPWRAPGFPAFVDRFALHAWLEGLAVYVLAPRALRTPLLARPRAARAALIALAGGTVLALGALAYSAATGVPGAQIRDAGEAGRAVLVARLAGELALFALLAVALWAATRHDD